MNLRVFYLYKTVGFGWLPSMGRNKKILAKEISSRGFFCLFDCSIIQRGA